MNGRVLRLRRVSRNVGGLDGMVAFYREALAFSVVEQVRMDAPGWGELMGVPGACARVARLRLGAQELELVAFDPPGAAYPAEAGASDLRFQHLAIVVGDMAAAYARLCRHAFAPISVGGPQVLPANTGGVSAFKFRDPEGHPLELIHFPAGAGAPCWQAAPGLFLGIDHSAIAVADTETSMDFYRRMGWRPTVCTHNRGPAQDRLDGLHGADVDVVSLQAAQDGPPHLELLGYRTPPGHGPRPAAGNDRVVDRLVLEVDDLQALLARLPGDAGTSAVDLDGQAMAMLQDPSGHRLLLQQGRSAAPG